MKIWPENPKTLADFADIDVEAVAAAIEADEGEPVPGIRDALGELKRGEIARVTTPAQLIIREARKTAGLSQSEFARRINTPVTTLQGWEQGRFSPPGAVCSLAQLIARHPDLVEELA
ncbi:MAG: helix-turn-helix domain-containing protein [Zoogloeaceae bacterium]|jgi:putative transcriptional regulator|nr:helix-turn-helix domain-containing protein [Zoogloeaceae bacterium]